MVKSELRIKKDPTFPDIIPVCSAKWQLAANCAVRCRERFELLQQNVFTIKIFTRKTAAGGWWRRRRRWGKSAACAEKTYECINTAAAAQQQQQQPAPRRRKARTVYSGPSSAERATDSATVFSWHIISKHSAKTENIVKLNWRISKGSKI